MQIESRFYGKNDIELIGFFYFYVIQQTRWEKNCQTHGFYVIFPVQVTDVVSFPVTSIFQQSDWIIAQFNVF